MPRKDDDKISMYLSVRFELEEYNNSGVAITLDGKASSPDEVAQICILKEESSYMRDYVTNEKGKLVELGFNRVDLQQ